MNIIELIIFEVVFMLFASVVLLIAGSFSIANSVQALGIFNYSIALLFIILAMVRRFRKK